MIKRQPLFRYTLSFFLIFGSCAQAFHTTTRYLPWLEKTNDIILKKQTQGNAEFFYISASTAQRRGGGTGSIPDLWGSYSLLDVAQSYMKVNGIADALNPINVKMLNADFENKAINYKVEGKVRAQGLTLGYDRNFKIKCLNDFSVGVQVPVIHASTLGRFNLVHIEDLSRSLTDREFNMLDEVRRDIHGNMGFQGDAWDASGFGDLDLHVQWNYFMDHQWMMRSIDSYIRAGILCPTGRTTKVNEPLSIPLGSNGHWGMYFDVLPEFELKPDWKFGFLFSALHQFKSTRTIRLPLGHEPAPFSALIGRVEVDPGVTMKLSPYFTLENLTDGVNFQFRYTYLRHSNDTWSDVRDDKTIKSYLDSTSSVNLTADQIAANIAQKTWLSRWTWHYASFQVTYDSKQALQNWVTNPLFYVTYDFPISGNSTANSHQVSLGARLHF